MDRNGPHLRLRPVCYFETKCPEAEASLLSHPGRVII